jgi:hypothetical protein
MRPAPGEDREGVEKNESEENDGILHGLIGSPLAARTSPRALGGTSPERLTRSRGSVTHLATPPGGSSRRTRNAPGDV